MPTPDKPLFLAQLANGTITIRPGVGHQSLVDFGKITEPQARRDAYDSMMALARADRPKVKAPETPTVPRTEVIGEEDLLKLVEAAKPWEAELQGVFAAAHSNATSQLQRPASVFREPARPYASEFTSGAQLAHMAAKGSPVR